MSTNDLPDEIVQPHHALAEHEEGVLGAWRATAPALLEAVLRLATSGLEPSARPITARCPQCQQRRGVQSRRTRGVQTRVGPIRLQHWWHHCWRCGHGWSPPDQALGLAASQQTSAGLARWEAALGAITTFREAAKLPPSTTSGRPEQPPRWSGSMPRRLSLSMRPPS